MSGVLGLLVVAAAVLLFGSLFFVSRRAHPPAWAELASNMGALAIVGLLALGIGSLVRFASALGTEPLGGFELALTVAAGVGLIAVTWSLRASWRRAVRRNAAAAAGEPGLQPTVSADVAIAGMQPANDAAAVDPIHPRPPAGGGRRRRAA